MRQGKKPKPLPPLERIKEVYMMSPSLLEAAKALRMNDWDLRRIRDREKWPLKKKNQSAAYSRSFYQTIDSR